MAAPLTDFLKSLATDQNQLAAFEKDPDRVMQAAGLSSAHQALIKSKDLKAISDAAIAEHPAPNAAAADFTFMIYIVIKF